MKKHLTISLSLLFAAGLFAQQPQTSTAPISAINAKYVQGVAPGYWPTAGSGLVLNLTAGTANCAGTMVTYAGGTLTMTASTTNYVYLNTAASCVPAVKTTAFTSSDIPIASVVAGASTITTITDNRTFFQVGSGSGGGYTLPSQYKTWSCEPGLGDGLNVITAGTYLESTCWNTTGVTVTLTGVKCYTDTGTSTLNAAGNTLGALLTGAVTCTSSLAAGTQSANVLLTSGDYIKFTFVANGTAKQATWVATGTY
jgi:hypothetical protein